MKRIYALAALLAAVATHRCVDLFVSFGVLRATDGGYAHLAVAPTAVAAVTIVLGLASFAYADRSGRFERIVRDLEAVAPIRTFVAIFALACVALFGIESFEQLVSLGHLDGTTAWLGTSVPAAIVLFAAIAFAATFVIHGGARGLLAALRAVRAIVEIAIAARARNAVVPSSTRTGAVVPVAYALDSMHVRGLRAPPLAG